jgi:hypothetical protein
MVIVGWGYAAVKQKPSRSAQHFKAKANHRVDDLQGMVWELQQARREGRLKDVALLEEQMHQMLREWKAELREASPASSLLVGNTSDALTAHVTFRCHMGGIASLGISVHAALVHSI